MTFRVAVNSDLSELSSDVSHVQHANLGRLIIVSVLVDQRLTVRKIQEEIEVEHLTIE